VNSKRSASRSEPEIAPSEQASERLSGVPTDQLDIDERLTTALEQVPEPQRRQVTEVVHEFVTSASFRGPMPHPGMLKGYEEVSPGISDRIVAMAEREQAHRHQWENRALSADRSYSLVGLVAGWTTAIGLAVGATIVGIFGHWSVGVALAAASATGMVWKLVQGRSEEVADQNAGNRPVSAPGKPEPAKRASKGR
jgi:uncharacterized membrane protein